MKNAPYLDCQTDYLKNEVWKDIEGFEGLYQVSNKGRVKSLDRKIPHPRLKSQFVKGRILKQKILVNSNSIDDFQLVSLQVALSTENNISYFNVRRLVFRAFVRRIDFSKDGLYVINNDFDGFNNSVENLKLVSKAEKSRRSFQSNRVPVSHLKTADRSKWVDKIYGGKARRKSLIQKDIITGEIVAFYESLHLAATLSKFDGKEISNCARGKRISYRGYKWIFKTKDSKVVREFLKVNPSEQE